MDDDDPATPVDREHAGPSADVQPFEGTPGGDDLTDNEVAVLELERSWWKYPGAKEAAVIDRFGWTLTRYYQVLDALIDTPAALAYDPVTVNWLRRLRATRRQARMPRTGGNGI